MSYNCSGCRKIRILVCKFSVKAFLKCSVSELTVKRFDKINVPIGFGLDIQQYSIYLVGIGI